MVPVYRRSARLLLGEPLFIADYNGSSGAMPFDWSPRRPGGTPATARFPGDQNLFNGGVGDLMDVALD